MNHWLVIPALCSLVVFAGLLIAFQQATGREPALQPMASDSGREANSERASGEPLAASEGEQLLKTLANAYERPWHEWQNSPTRLYSRAAPRPVPTVIVETNIAPSGKVHDRLLLATVTVRRGKQSETIPCVIDQTTKEVRLFANGEWVTGADWLKTAPRTIRD